MGNTYILYYICPLHTFYFLVVYSIMRPVRSANYSKNGIRYKMLIAGLIIFCVWDLDIQLFDKVQLGVLILQNLFDESFLGRFDVSLQ